MGRRKTHREEFKREAVRLIRDRGVTTALVSDLGVDPNLLRLWVKAYEADPAHACPGHRLMKPEQLEIDRLRREVTKLKTRSLSLVS